LLEPGWFCTLALKSKPLDFLKKSFLDPQHLISSLNSRKKRGTPHRLVTSGSFRAPSFHVGPKPGVTNSKKNRKNAKPSRGIILCDLEAGKKNSNLKKNCLPESPVTEMTNHVRGCMTFRLNELDSAMSTA
jgi:hypothetical protein